MIRRSAKAYTLLEVILAIGLIVGLMGAAFAFYHRTITVRESVNAEVQKARTVRALMDLMTAELQNAIMPDASVAPLMTTEVIEFSTVSLPGSGAWVERTNVDVPISPESDVSLVSYELDISENEDGEMENMGLSRACWKVTTIEALADDEADDLAVHTLASEILFVRFRYYAGQNLALDDDVESAGGIVEDGWVEQWDRFQLPLAVEITLGFDPQEEGEDADEYIDAHETYRRVVYLPGSTVGKIRM